MDRLLKNISPQLKKVFKMKKLILIAALFITSIHAHVNAQDVTLTTSNGSNTLALKTCTHDAGAFCSLIYNGKQFLNDYDHGRQLQSASSFDGLGEMFNPTEAGSYLDGLNPSPSSSRSWMLTKVNDNTLISYTQMAFWYKYNGQALSNHYLTKIVTTNFNQKFNIIEYTTQFKLPIDEVHTSATFEVLTAYLHPSFTSFYVLDNTNVLQWLSPTPVGEQNLPIMAVTSDHMYAIGFFSPDTPQPAYPQAGYGRWKFPDTTKINNVYRITNPTGKYTFKTYVVIGNYQMVKDGLIYLKATFNK